MTLVLRDDGARIGHVLLELDPAHTAPLSVSLQFPDKTYLGADGRRGRGRHLFPAEGLDASGARFALGPEVTAHVREAEIVTLADAEGAGIGTASWDGIRAPPGAAGGGLRLAGGARRGPTSDRSGAPILGGKAAAATAPAAVAATTPPETPSPKLVPDDPPALLSPRRRLALPIGLALVAVLVIALLAAVLAGLIGWRLEPREIAFEGPQGGPFRPAIATARLERIWGAALLAPLFGKQSPLAAGPAWLALRPSLEGSGWRFDLAIDAAATRALAPGRTTATLPLAFPMRAGVPGLVVTLRIEPPAPPPPPAPPAAVAGIDDALCDKLAGNKFDPDHPAGRPAQDEIFDLPPDQSAAGLTACDPREDRVGADRRFLVQRGRLLAERALRRLAAGDVAGATADMDAAVAAWTRGDALGSAYAANLLGAYHKGTFNRPAHAFVAPDDGAAVRHWQDGMRRGSAVAQRNYAAELMMGHGIAAEPARALDLLRDALARGEPRAAGVLGVALYTGAPPGVPRDKQAGWPLVVSAQCLDRNARTLVEQEVAHGTHPASDRTPCR